MRMRWSCGVVLLLLAAGLEAQNIQPLITEYKGAADGKFAVTNTTETPMVVVLEPRSFDVNEEGKGIYRDLDSEIHVELSTMSFPLQPGETHYVFYKASAERLPAWFTVYATFSLPRHGEGLDVRLMLPHTVYLYSKRAVTESDLEVDHVAYDPDSKHLTGMLMNRSDALVRVQGVKATGGHGAGDGGGFPLLPGQSRHVVVDWTGSAPPTGVEFRFNGFTVKRAIGAGD